ncbi:SMI1/KNR4 family protein [candidate division CSSED10-310 bacterium]|uniref:SMI1/KNR4 family protein n=1 Tax=candidate division CSSED10-310 bacterium TaxID=2855610 RepID=A0ABV6Z4X8_UNCC1
MINEIGIHHLKTCHMLFMIIDKIHKSLPREYLKAPCSQDEMNKAEEELRFSLPPVLKEIYNHYNGIVGPYRTYFLFPLGVNEIDKEYSLVSWNLFWQPDGNAIPDWISEFVAYGFSSAQETWAMRRTEPYDIIVYYLPDSDEFKQFKGDLVDLIIADQEGFTGL